MGLRDGIGWAELDTCSLLVDGNWCQRARLWFTIAREQSTNKCSSSCAGGGLKGSAGGERSAQGGTGPRYTPGAEVETPTRAEPQEGDKLGNCQVHGAPRRCWEALDPLSEGSECGAGGAPR